jgi:ribosome biogenesis GTPase / thiamine phosphate phosphatase
VNSLPIVAAVTACARVQSAPALVCRFRDCTHHAEPGCAVRDHIDPDRLKNYHKLAREAQRQRAKDSDDPNAIVRFEAEQKARWKAIHKSVRGFNKANR